MPRVSSKTTTPATTPAPVKDTKKSKTPKEPVQKEIEPVVESTLVVEETVETPATSESEPAKPQTTSRWAEVLFGAKEEDEETF